MLSSVFYDDYPYFEVEPLTQITVQTLDKFSDILDWRHAVTGKKATDFGQELQALGAQYDPKDIWSGRIVVRNKPGRNERVLQLMADLRDDPLTGEKLVFHGVVPQVLLDHWLEVVGDQVICEVEMYTYLCVRRFFRRQWTARCGLCFIGNEACRLSLIKRSSPSVAMFLLICSVSNTDTRTPLAAWLEGVPSPANPADLPSRRRPKELCGLIEAIDS